MTGKLLRQQHHGAEALPCGAPEVGSRSETSRGEPSIFEGAVPVSVVF